MRKFALFTIGRFPLGRIHPIGAIQLRITVMTHKLEVLKPRAGAAPAPPRVLADASLSLSFKLPAGFSRPPARASRSPPASSSTSSTSNEPNVPPRDSWSDDDDKEDDESWETRDFSAGLAASSGDTAGHGKGDEDDELEDATSAAATSPALEVGGWEEQDALELPDDFPLLLVNLTRLQREHFPPDPSAAQSPLSADDTRQLFELVKQTLHRHFTQMVEVLFEQSASAAAAAVCSLVHDDGRSRWFGPPVLLWMR